MPVNNPDFEAQRFAEEARMRVRRGAATPAGRAEAARFRQMQAELPPKSIFELAAETEKDTEQIDAGPREKFLRENIGVRVAGQTARERPPGSIHEATFNRLNQDAELVEAFLNNGYDSLLNDADRDLLRTRVETMLAKYPAIGDLLPPVGARRQEALADLLRRPAVRAAIRTEYKKSIGIEGLTIADEAALQKAVADVDREITKKDAEIAENARRKAEAEVDVAANVPPGVTNAEQTAAQTAFENAANEVRRIQREIRKNDRVVENLENKIKEFTDPTGTLKQELEAHQALVRDPAYSADKIRDARATVIAAAKEIKDRQEELDKLKPQAPRNNGGGGNTRRNTPPPAGPATLPPEYAAVKLQLDDAIAREKAASEIVEKYNRAVARIQELAVERNSDEENLDLEKDARTVNQTKLLEQQARERQARALAGKLGGDIVSSYDEKEEELRRDLEDLQLERTKKNTELDLGRTTVQQEISKRISGVMENGLQNYMNNWNDADKKMIRERLTQEQNKVKQALLRMYDSRWTEEGMRGIANIPGLRNIRQRPASVPREAIIQQDLEQLFEHGENLPDTLRYMLNQYILWQRAETVGVPPAVGAAPGTAGTSRILEEHLLTQAEIDEFLSDRDATSEASKEMAGRILAARMTLGRLTPRETDLVNTLVTREWAKEVFNNADKIIKENRSLNEALRRNGMTQRDLMDYVNAAKNSKNATGLATILALLVGGVIPAGIVFYAMNKRGGAGAGPVDATT